MKDYLLSEIRHHNREEGWQVTQDDLSVGFREEAILSNLRETLPLCEIGPRDMLELPCKLKVHIGGAKTAMWQVVYRDDEIRIELFKDEEYADKFIEQLKNKKG